MAILSDHAYFQVAVKAVLRKDDKILKLTSPNGGVDFPGGRMDSTEVELPMAEVLKREIREELGPDVTFNHGKLAFVARRVFERDGDTKRILAIYYEVEYLGGDIQLSDEHTQYEWLDPKDLLPLADKFITRDEYEQFAAYFAD